MDPKAFTFLAMVPLVWGAVLTTLPGDRRRWFLPLFTTGALLMCVAAVLYQDWSMLALEAVFTAVNVYGLWRVFVLKQ